MRVGFVFVSSAVFGWSLTTLVVTRPETIPHLATLLFGVLSLEYWLARRMERSRAEAALPVGLN